MGAEQPREMVLDADAEEQPEAILATLEFPECNGLDVVGRLKEASPQTHFLLFASPGKYPSLGEAARAGAEVLLPEAQGSDAVLRHLEDAIGELPGSRQS